MKIQQWSGVFALIAMNISIALFCIGLWLFGRKSKSIPLGLLFYGLSVVFLWLFQIFFDSLWKSVPKFQNVPLPKIRTEQDMSWSLHDYFVIVLIDIGVIIAFIAFAICIVYWIAPKDDDPTHMRKI